MSEDLYEGFADRYDWFFSQFDDYHPDVKAFFHKVFTDHGVANVLDCACGTGRDLALFQSLGVDVHGSDSSSSMLAQAEKNFTERGLNIPLKNADYRELTHVFTTKFDAVVCLSSSLLHMPDEQEALKALTSMRRVLRDNGILILTQGTTDKQWKQKPRFIPAVITSEFSRIFVIDYIAEGARYNILDIFSGQDGPGFKVFSVDYPFMILRDDQERLLKDAGFQQIKFFGGYGFELYDKAESDQLITVACT